ncbi:MAG: D-aminoacyl-tRNA deacylase [bacterium]
MKLLIQRVTSASVSVDNKVVGKIQKGIVLFIGIGKNDQEKDIDWLIEKTINLRIFPDNSGKMNHSLLDINGEILAISQFTLYGNCNKGRRPSYDEAAPPAQAEQRYNQFIEKLHTTPLKIETGTFQAKMLVQIINDGPVTFSLESK